MNDLTPTPGANSKDPEAKVSWAERPSATRAQAAVALRLAGTPFADIAETLGFPTAADARKAIESILASTVEDEDIASQRQLLNSRLNRVLQSVWPRAVNNKDPKHLQYMNAFLAIEERRARLLGTDAPTKHEVYTPTAEQITEQVRVLTANVIVPVEADIVDAEEVDDADAG